MAIRNFAKYLAAAILAVACTAQEPFDTQAPTSSEPVASEAFTPAVNIQFSDELIDLIEEDLNLGVQTKSAGLNAVLEELNIERLERIFPDAGEFEPRSRAMGMHRFYRAVLRSDVPATKAAVSLADVPGIISATPSRRIVKRAFNDKYFSKQWHYVNKSYSNADINVQGVWDKYTKGNSQVIVCVVDEPIDPTHEDLVDNLWKDSQGHTGYNYVRKSYDMTIRPENGEGDIGHGTHVAGTIGAMSNNNKGVAGIAGGDASVGQLGVRLMSHAIFSGSDVATDANTYRAIKEAADKGAVISNNSWGYSADGAIDGEQDGTVSSKELAEYKSWAYDPSLQAAFEYFAKYAGCDAQGNQRADSPMKGGLIFAACGNEGIDYDYIGANDPNVISVGSFGLKGGRATYSNYGSYVDIAAPGGAAQVDNDYIWSTVPRVLSSTGYEGIDKEGYVWVGTSMACPHASGVAALIVSYFGGPGFTADAAKEILFAGLGNTIGGKQPIGKKLDALASFDYGVKHYPAGGGGVPPVEPSAPMLTLSQNSVSVKAHEEVAVTFMAYDPDGDPLTISLTAGSRALTLNEADYSLVIDGWKDNPGTYTAILTVSDGTYFTSATLEYTLLPNHAPKVVGSVNNILLYSLQTPGIVPLESVFRDEDGETLSINYQNSDSACANVSYDKENNRILVTPLNYGGTEVTVKASDFLGEEASVGFKVAIVNPDEPVRVTPEVASTDAYISVETENAVTVKLQLYSATGTRVLEMETKASAFDPIHLDVSTLAPGRYTAILEYEGLTRKVRVIKY